MVVVSVMYNSGLSFDEAYYFGTHMPLVRARFAGLLADARVLKGLAGPGGGTPAYQIVAELTFPSMAAAQQALGGPHAAEIMADIEKFTDAQPVFQISEVHG